MANAQFDRELKALGARLRTLRKHRQLKLLDMEILCGIQDSKLSRIERGLENVEVQTVYKLARALQVELRDIFDYEGSLPDNKNFKGPVRF
jgi:transcriptional regulator with XRE-family HTH domain